MTFYDPFALYVIWYAMYTRVLTIFKIYLLKIPKVFIKVSYLQPIVISFYLFANSEVSCFQAIELR